MTWKDWKKAGEIDELKSILSKNPTPLKKVTKEYQNLKKVIFSNTILANKYNSIFSNWK